MGNCKSIMVISKINNTGTLNQRFQHDYRTRDVPNADPSVGNDFLVKCNGSYADAFDEKLNSLDYYKSHKFRSNGVMALDINLTYSHDAEKELGFSVEEWEKKNLEWLRETFNSSEQYKYGDNVVSVVCHRDESTPHIHAIVIPVDNKGKINASYYTGNRDMYFAMQDSYGKKMHHEFKLQRGVKYSSATHDTMRKLYAEVRNAMYGVEPVSKEPQESVQQFEQRVNEIRQTEALSHLRQVNELKREITAVKDTFRADPDKDSHIIRLEKDNTKLRAEHHELVHEFGSMKDIRTSCQIMQNLKDASEEYPDRDKYEQTINNIADIVSWQENNGRRKRYMDKMKEQEISRDKEEKVSDKNI